MSKYTTQVRFICENKSGLENSFGADSVDDVIAGSWNKIFTSKAPFFDEKYRSFLCQKILKHYYLREICCETVGIWTLWMNTRLEEIMPYYNQLYESAKLKIEPLIDTDYTTESLYDKIIYGSIDSTGNIVNNGTIDISGNAESSGSVTNNGKVEVNENNETHNEGENRKLYSDTPQGSIVGLEDNTYLTNATIDSNVNDGRSETTNNSTEERTTNTTDTSNNTSNTTENRTINSTGTSKNNSKENAKNNVITKGKMNGKSYSEMLNEFRSTFLNIDLQVIEEFSDLFFGLW